MIKFLRNKQTNTQVTHHTHHADHIHAYIDIISDHIVDFTHTLGTCTHAETVPSAEYIQRGRAHNDQGRERITIVLGWK